MFGTNPLRKKEAGDGMSLWVQEVFPTIQGEGPFVGLPAVFVRLAGCNLACTFCDTDFESSTWRPTIDELENKIIDCSKQISNATLVVFTGGEPLRQNVLPIVDALNARRFHVQFETAGTLWWDALGRYDNVSFVVSPKTGKVNAHVEQYATAYKYITRLGQASEEDGLPLYSTQQKDKKLKLARPPARLKKHQIYLQPCDEHDAELSKETMHYTAALCMKHGYRLCLQTHKIVNLP